ncbi:Npun_F0494 family protein, partial [Vulcanococcus sp.]|uniref:Npun_F0494 family protein n=1 Tax=Vulcanococcus sp. TaxID=2856995 RepID=UPI0037DA6E2D
LSRTPLSANRTEDLLIWLIRLGVLRREVDGQGLTERVRLTPLGRDSIADWHDTIPPAGPLTRLSHWLRQHRPHL